MSPKSNPLYPEIGIRYVRISLEEQYLYDMCCNESNIIKENCHINFETTPLTVFEKNIGSFRKKQRKIREFNPVLIAGIKLSAFDYDRLLDTYNLESSTNDHASITESDYVIETFTATEEDYLLSSGCFCLEEDDSEYYLASSVSHKPTHK